MDRDIVWTDTGADDSECSSSVYSSTELCMFFYNVKGLQNAMKIASYIICAHHRRSIAILWCVWHT